MLIDYPDVPRAIGRFEGDAFDPWSGGPSIRILRSTTCGRKTRSGRARIVSRFNDAAIRAVVEKAHYTDPRVTDYMTATLIKRRDKALCAWLNAVNPVIDPALSAGGAADVGQCCRRGGRRRTPP